MPSLLQAPGVSARFLDLLAEEPLARSRVLDVGCGAGRLSLALAPASKRVVGLDRDAALIQEARRRSSAAGFANTEFHEADVESEPYGPWKPDLVTAHLCASDAIVERAARALGPGSCLAMVSFHVDQWRETGKISRFAYDETRMRSVLEGQGFAVEALEVERDVRRFSSVEEGLAA
ncbi:MAG: class I SAM-dependent methyltransferase, partial [Candidatus Rokuibacteriota bacterium]